MSRAKLLDRLIYRIGVALALTVAIAALANFSHNPGDGRATAQVAPPTGSSDDRPVAVAPAASPLMIVENAGQWDERARFQVWGGPAGTMWLAEDGIWLTVVEPEREEETSRQGDKAAELGGVSFAEERWEPAPRRAVAIKLSFVGANPHPQIETFDRLDTKVSYFIGNDPEQWRPEAPVWGGVRYVDLYPGVDLVVGTADEQGSGGLWHLRVHDGGDASAVRLRVEGADTVTVEDGRLRLSTAAGEASLTLPTAGLPAQIEIVTTDRQSIVVATLPSTSDATSNLVSSEVAPDDNPADLLHSTFLGGSGTDCDTDCAVKLDPSGAIHVTGHTDSSDFPTTPGAFDRDFNGFIDIFVSKLSANGSLLTYTTFLGGMGADDSNDIAVDGAGLVYLTGSTSSVNFPVTPGAFDPTMNSPMDAFVVKLNAAGSSLVYSTYLGGGSWDGGLGVATDSTGAAYTTGYTRSDDFPVTANAFDRSHNGNDDVFVTKLSAAGTGLSYSTFLGGSGYDVATAIAFHSNGAASVTGVTDSTDFPTTVNAVDRSFNGNTDAFYAKLSGAGSNLEYATYLGGASFDEGTSLALDGSGSAYLTGATASSDFPTTSGAFDTSFNGTIPSPN